MSLSQYHVRDSCRYKTHMYSALKEIKVGSCTPLRYAHFRHRMLYASSCKECLPEWRMQSRLGDMHSFCCLCQWLSWHTFNKKHSVVSTEPSRLGGNPASPIFVASKWEKIEVSEMRLLQVLYYCTHKPHICHLQWHLQFLFLVDWGSAQK